MIDRNKTEITHNITRLAALWLDNHGFKPVETEVGVDQGWIADIAGVGCLTQTEYIGLKLLKRPPRWHYDANPSQQIIYEDAYQVWRAARDVIPQHHI
jgi:hypothetical protein